MQAAPRKFTPLLIAGAILALGIGALVVLRQDPEKPEPVPAPDPRLSSLGQKPDWKRLQIYDRTLTRTEFEKAMREVYVLDDNWHCTIADDAVTIHSELQPGGQAIKFADSETTAAPPRYWRAASELGSAPADKPLEGLHIAIDAGHIGGDWAKMEERWYKRGTTKPVAEGDMTLRTAQILKLQLESLGAKVSMVREKTEPITDKRPEDFAAIAARRMPGAPESEVRKAAEKLFYRTSEIRARAHLVNEKIKPDIILCLHFNAEGWGSDADNPRFSPRNHFHLILHGAYMAGEIAHEDERFEMMHKVFQRVHEEEAAIAAELAKSFQEETNLPRYVYLLGKPTKRIGPGLWARNLLANRLYQCPVLFFEPYVMNNRDVHARVQAGDYEGEKEVNGRTRKSIYREYAQAVVNGLVNYYKPRRSAAP